MRFKVCTINCLGNFHDETVIANNKSEEKSNVQLFYPISKVFKLNGSINNYY